jgi:hypothetical protein
MGALIHRRYRISARSVMDNQPPSPEIVREQHELAQRLATIFMPEASRQLLAFYQRVPGQTHGRVVHYTTAEAALNIIRTKRMWMRNTNCMADYREVQMRTDDFLCGVRLAGTPFSLGLSLAFHTYLCLPSR